MTAPARWPAIEAARRQDANARVPFTIDGAIVGSAARAHLDALRRWPQWLVVDAAGVALVAPAAEREGALDEVHRRLRDEGLIRAWRDERYAVCDPATLQPLLRIERAASRFWGTLTFGAHCTGYVADEAGRPTALWIAQRAFTKATDPGLFDNLVGGGVPAGQTPFETLVREGFEEAGLPPEAMRRARPGRVLALDLDVREGRMREHVHAFDLRLQPGERPANQDGEVHAFTLMPVAEALALAAGEAMTVDASLVTLDFALRHQLLGEARDLVARAAPLWVNMTA